MIKRTILTAACSILGFVSASGSATAETIGRLDCSVVGVTSQEPIGDRDGHRLTNVQFACFGADGPLKGAVYTGSSTQEWDGPQSTFLAAGGIYRVPGGLAVSQAIEGTSSAVMKDGKPIGNESSGKTRFKFASGTLAALAGKTARFETKPTGVGRFSLEYTADSATDTVGAGKQ
jgi:hypothetical protein